jgi:3-hydroxyisobutyrate dehydrogenase-like beta-hydroxyacid dehydrogenase
VAQWDARQAEQLDPIEQAMGWSLSSDAKGEIDRILRATVIDPVSDVIMSCLSNDNAVNAIYEGGDGAISSAARQHHYRDKHGLPRNFPRVVANRQVRGLDVLDVAISGGPTLASSDLADALLVSGRLDWN